MKRILTPRLNRYIPHQPTTKQAAFLLLNNRESLYGGAAGGGKSDALLMAALQYVDIPDYAALLLRRTYRDLSLPGALLPRADEWLSPTDARWHDESKTWYFPSGATLTFGYLENAKDQYRYQSSAFQFIGFDELTQFEENQYRYLFSRLRRLKGVTIPIRMRSATNPGGIGGPWVYQRFLVEGKSKGRLFIPAKLEDNPHLDQDDYISSLDELDPVTKAQLLKGDWEIRESGNKFQRAWFKLVNDFPGDALKFVRFWDLAATEPKPGKDPDYTVGTLAVIKEGVYYVIDVIRFRGTPMYLEAQLLQTAQLDHERFGNRLEIWIEQEGGASGKGYIDHLLRKVLVGFTARGQHPTKDKEFRSNPVSSAAEAGNIRLVRGKWINDWLDEFEIFPLGPHDDQVDSMSGAFEKLTGKKKKKTARSFSWSSVGGTNEED